MTRRTFIIGGSVAGAAAATAAILSNRGPAPPVATLTDSPQRFVAANGMLSVELTSSEQRVELAGTRGRLYTFNGRVPGPVLELRAGDDVRLRLRNELSEPTNLHFHGIHLPPDGKADNVFLRIPAGEFFDYAFRVPPNHPAGLFWVHPHLHGLVAKQVSLGLAAPFIVRGELDRIPEVAAAHEHLLILQDFELRSDGRPADPGMSAMMLGREGSLITVSGTRTPQYVIEQDGMLRLRLLNASVSRFYRLAVDEHPMHVIATDGGARATTQTVDDLVLAPGERRDVLIQGTRGSGSYRLMNLPYDRGSMGMMGGSGMMGRGGIMGGRSMMRGDRVAPATELATLVYQGRATRRLNVPQTLIDVPALPAASIRRTFDLGDAMGMRLGGMGMRFVINDREFDHERIDTRVRLDSVEEWEYVNRTTMDHPMHIHTNPVQLVGPDNTSERAWQDIVVVKAGSRVRFRVKFEEFAGKTVQHCHILDHEDRGMMATILMEQ
ncbi:MAG TPA: multicopper oxidase family protein [Vicinamibacterales bacterium]|nr:multicopper oxidase family protein [Vicinamibacterales bacterium]